MPPWDRGQAEGRLWWRSYSTLYSYYCFGFRGSKNFIAVFLSLTRSLGSLLYFLHPVGQKLQQFYLLKASCICPWIFILMTFAFWPCLSWLLQHLLAGVQFLMSSYSVCCPVCCPGLCRIRIWTETSCLKLPIAYHSYLMIYYGVVIHVCIVIKPILLSRAHLSFPAPHLPSPSPCPRILAPFVLIVAQYLDDRW